MSKHGQRLYDFGPFRLDADNHALLREGRPVTLTRKAVEMLIVLVENRGEVVEKEALLKRLWPDTTVEDSNLTQNVYMIRQALGEGAQQQAYIETVPKRGYRFAAEVTEHHANGHGHASNGEAAPPAAAAGRHTQPDQHTTTDPHATSDATAATPTHVAGPHTSDAAAASLSSTTAESYSSMTATADDAGEVTIAPNARASVTTGFVPAAPLRAQAVAPPRRLFRVNLTVFAAVAVAVAVALAAAAYVFRSKLGARPARGPRVIAVLPLKHIGPEGEGAHLGLGMTDAMITKLSNLQQIQVRPTSAIFKYTAADYDPVKAGRDLGVDAVVEGSVQRSGDSVRVTVRLLSIPDGQPLWGEIYNKKATDLFAVQDAISEEVAQALRLRLTSVERSQLAKHHTQNPEAYQAYARGFYFCNLRTEDGFRQSIRHYDEAVAKDPSYALAYAGLADAYGLVAYYRYERVVPRDEALRRARAAAARAAQLDDVLPEAHAAVGLVRSLEGDIDGAVTGYKRALAINPNYATARQRYALTLLTGNRLEEATAEVRRAQALDPLSTVININLAQMYYFSRDYEGAAAVCEKTLETTPPGRVHHLLLLNLLGNTRAQQGRRDEARALFGRALEQDGEFDEAREGLAYTAALAGDREGAEKYLPRFHEMTGQYRQAHLSLALAHSALGDLDEAFKHLDHYAAGRPASPPILRFDPRLDRMRADPRFAELLKRRFGG